MLWQLATLYGKVRRDGVLVPMRLSHEALGRMVGARRPTVTLALTALGEQGLVTTDGVGGFLLSTDSRSILVPPRPASPSLNGAGVGSPSSRVQRAGQAGCPGSRSSTSWNMSPGVGSEHWAATGSRT